MENKIPIWNLENCSEYKENGRRMMKCEIKKYVRVYQDGTVRDNQGRIVDNV